MAQEADESRSMAESLPDAPVAAPTKRSYRSYKKKYAKLKVKFELGMRDSEALIREELRIEDLSKRIQEQNDQLLEVLLEFNESLYVSPTLRYDLKVPGDPDYEEFAESNRGVEPSISEIERATRAWKSTKDMMDAGIVSVPTYRAMEKTVKESPAFAPQMKYISLSQVPHTAPHPEGDRPAADSDFECKLGFLTPEHETEYYLAMDAKLGDPSAALQLSRAPEKPSFAEREREAALRNPISVYNWLRRNQPNVFLQDNEIASEKSGSRPANLRSSKRASTQARKDEDMYDEDGILLDVGPTPKGKRKRDEDTGYRPKGGSSRPKKKKDDTSYSGRRASKRSSGVGA